MAWYHLKLRNQWTRPKPGCEDADVGAWQVGFAACGRFTIVGVFDHIIESRTHIRNIGKRTDAIWADVVLALGEGFGSLYNEYGSMVEHSVKTVLDHLGSWGRNPDDVAEGMLFSLQPQVPESWWEPLLEPESCLGPKPVTVAKIAERYSGIVIWALDGHLYAALPSSGSDIRERLMPAAAALELRVAEHHKLIV